MIYFYHFNVNRTLLPFVLAKLLKQFQNTSEEQHTTIKLNLSEINSTNIILLNDNKTDIDNLTNYNENLNLFNNYSNSNMSQNYTIISETYSSNVEYISTNVYWLATQIVILSLFSALFDHHSDLRQRLVGARMKIACSSLIYRKVNLIQFIKIYNIYLKIYNFCILYRHFVCQKKQQHK